MTISFPVKEDKKDIIPGIVHVDGSCRIQTVDESIPHYFNLLNEFNNITGVPLLLNTSFNMAGEALIETPEEAINTFEKTDLDCLWFPEIGEILTR
jgi:carbamoyltransferase